MQRKSRWEAPQSGVRLNERANPYPCQAKDRRKVAQLTKFLLQLHERTAKAMTDRYKLDAKVEAIF